MRGVYSARRGGCTLQYYRIPFEYNCACSTSTPWCSLLLLLLFLRLLSVDSLSLRGALALTTSFVDGVPDLHRSTLECVRFFLDRLKVLLLYRCLELIDGSLNGACILSRQLILVLAKTLLGRIENGISVILRFNHGLALLVLGSKCLCIPHHLLNVLVTETTRGADCDGLL